MAKDRTHYGPLTRAVRPVMMGGILLGYLQDAQNVTAAVREQLDVSACFDDLRAGRWEALATLV